MSVSGVCWSRECFRTKIRFSFRSCFTTDIILAKFNRFAAFKKVNNYQRSVLKKCFSSKPAFIELKRPIFLIGLKVLPRIYFEVDHDLQLHHRCLEIKSEKVSSNKNISPFFGKIQFFLKISSFVSSHVQSGKRPWMPRSWATLSGTNSNWIRLRAVFCRCDATRGRASPSRRRCVTRRAASSTRSTTTTTTSSTSKMSNSFRRRARVATAGHLTLPLGRTTFGRTSFRRTPFDRSGARRFWTRDKTPSTSATTRDKCRSKKRSSWRDQTKVSRRY